MESDNSPIIEEDDPGLNFIALHRCYALPSAYGIKETNY